MTRKLLEEVEGEPVEFNINTQFAEKYAAKKRHEELSILEDKYRDKLLRKGAANVDVSDASETEDSEADVVEDEDGELATPAVEVQILRTLAEIRARDERIYDPTVQYFQQEDLAQAEQQWREKQRRLQREEKPLTLKDYQRSRVLAEQDGESEGEGEGEGEEAGFVDRDGAPIRTFVEEQEDLKRAFKQAAEQALPEEGTDSLLRLRPKTDEEVARESEEYRTFILENLARSEHAKESMGEWFQQNAANLDKDDAFLINYVLNRGWVDKERKALPTYDQIVEEEEAEDEEAMEQMEQFEEKYNFRFEQAGGDQIATYARSIEGSMRREPQSKRKLARDAKKQRQEAEKQQQREELKRLKNLKRAEIAEKLRRIQAISGNDRVEDLDLESDFDPEKHDSKMGALFDDAYYGEEERGKPVWTDSEAEGDLRDDATAAPVDKELNERVIKKAARSLLKAQKKARKAAEAAKEAQTSAQLAAYLDEYYQLDYEDMVAGIPCRFRYAQVKPTTFGLKVTDIMNAEDADLNAHVSLKKLAPYRPEEVFGADEAKYGSKKRLYRFYDLVKRKRDDAAAEGGGDTKKGRKGEKNRLQ